MQSYYAEQVQPLASQTSRALMALSRSLPEGVRERQDLDRWSSRMHGLVSEGFQNQLVRNVTEGRSALPPQDAQAFTQLESIVRGLNSTHEWTMHGGQIPRSAQTQAAAKVAYSSMQELRRRLSDAAIGQAVVMPATKANSSYDDSDR